MYNSRLLPGPELPDPTPLASNSGCSFIGSKIYGQGFLLTPEERAELVAGDARNAERIFPYIGGKEVNTSPEQAFHRYVISFGDLSLKEAEAWPDLLSIVREKVKPERDKLRDNAVGKRRKQFWWQFGGGANPHLYAAIAPLQRCLVTARVTKHLCFSFQPTDRILNEKLYVFPFERYAPFAVLQSRVHEAWVRLLSSTLKTDLNYSASDCFETFPFPQAEDAVLESVGEALYEWRAGYMVQHNIGLTKLYNDPPRELTRLTRELDAAVLDAYGWNDLEPESPKILTRLFDLNSERKQNEN